MSEFELTDDQKLAATLTGLSLTVSAAAGSGKTSVLAQRCAHLVCDAPARCNIDELLVVTFTEAAAAGGAAVEALFLELGVGQTAILAWQRFPGGGRFLTAQGG